MIIHLSKKLADKIHETNLEPCPLDPDPYSDWHGHLFNYGRARYIILVNSHSLFTVFLYSTGVTSGRIFIERAFEAIQTTLRDYQLDHLFDVHIGPQAGNVRFAKSTDKRIIGSINEQLFYITAILDGDDLNLFEMAVRCNENLLSYISKEKNGYGRPLEALTGKKRF